MAGYRWTTSTPQMDVYYKAAIDESSRRYPLPKEPTIVTDTEGNQYKFSKCHDKYLMVHVGNIGWKPVWIEDIDRHVTKLATPSRILSLAEIAKDAMEDE